jgi:uncharacterized secreted protein with C-terminal beta-propeller domain
MVLAMCLLLTGCKTTGTHGKTQGGQNAPLKVTAELNKLKTVGSYSEIFKQLSSYYKEAQNRNDGYYTTTTEDVMEESTEVEMETEAPTAANTAAGESKDFSETNVQVEGIDEADIIKTDGRYIYYLNGNRLKIIEAKGAETVTVSETELSVENEDIYKYISDIYLVGDSLVAIGSRYDYNASEDVAIAVVYDISDRTAPKQVEEFGQSGYVSSTRLVGDILYVVSTYSVWEGDIIAEEPETYVPCLYAGTENGLVEVEDICIPEEINNTSWLTVSAYDVTNRERLSTKTMLGRADNMYMSAANIYVAENVWVNEASDEYTQDQYTVTDYLNYSKTNIYKFSYADGQVEYLCSGAIVGGLLDQFSMDEYEGNLRVVTTRNDYSYRVYRDDKYDFTNYEHQSDSMDNGLYVLDPDMKVIGSVEHLGEDERVYSVRFNGSVGYFVTFRETDPLFAVDLTNPASPTVLSALKINGFSQYLHNWGDGLLLGLGMEADDEGRVETMKLSMFDVSDPTNVTEQDKTVLPYWYSNGLYDHHAVFVDVERGLVGFGVEGDNDTGYVLYRYENGGFTQFAKIAGDEYSYDARGLRIEEYFYVVTNDNVRVVDMASGTVIR